jgi:hypothetical protein
MPIHNTASLFHRLDLGRRDRAKNKDAPSAIDGQLTKLSKSAMVIGAKSAGRMGEAQSPSLRHDTIAVSEWSRLSALAHAGSFPPIRLAG